MTPKLEFPDWFRIVKDFGFRNGPTIPFILGAARIRPLNHAPRTRAVGQIALHELLKDMHSTALADGYGVAIEWCPTIGTWVVAKRRPALTGLEWDVALKATTVDSLFGNFWRGYGDVISAGEYSKNPVTGRWEPFSAADEGRIRELLG